MPQPSSRRSLAAVGTVAFSLALTGALVAPALAGAATQGHRAKAATTMVKLETSKKYGKILENTSGKTLYALSVETTKTLKCTGPCLKLWPPLLTKTKPQAGPGIVAKELGTVKRGTSLQVTYYGHPLYTYSGDKTVTEQNGEGIAAFGGWWYVVNDHGAPVKAALTSSSGGSGTSGGW